MKLKFKKDQNKKVTLLMDDREFDSSFYLEIVKNIADGQKLDDPELGKGFSSEEKENIQEMIKEINSIGDKNALDSEDKKTDVVEYPEKNINLEDIPF